jgi:hypothetical protein
MKRLLLTVLVTALVTAAATCVALSLTKSEPLTDWIKMAKMRLYGCSSPEVCLEKAKRIREQMDAVGMHEPIGITIREGKRSVPEEIFAPNGARYSPTSKEIFVLVTDTSEGLIVYEFDLMKIMCDGAARKQLEQLIIQTNAQSNDFGIKDTKVEDDAMTQPRSS